MNRKRSATALLVMLMAMQGAVVYAGDGAGVGSPVSRADERNLRWNVAVVPAQAKPGDEVEVVFTADIAPGWILYSSDFSLEIGPRATKFTFDANPALTLVGPIEAVKSKRKKDRTLGAEYTYFATHAEFRQKARLAAPLTGVSGRIDGQTCQEESGLCELFREKFSASVSSGAEGTPGIAEGAH